MRDCPDCGAPVDGLVCPSCGHGAPPKKNNTPTPYVRPPDLPRATAEGNTAMLKALALARSFGKVSDDPRKWARKIIERLRNGERVPIVALEAAREAARPPPPPLCMLLRQPGEDDA